jgi:hypothetical protein
MSCLFNSLSKFTPGVSSLQLRNQICDFLLKNDVDPEVWGDLTPSKVAEIEGMTLQSYVAKMKLPSVWGGALEIFAFVHIYKTNVEVVNIRDAGRYTLLKPIEFVLKGNEKTVKISWNGGHYEPL